MKLLLRGRIFPANGTEVILDGHILVAEGRILSVGEGLPSILDDTKVIDVGDKTILPGLIDSHVHLAGLHSLEYDVPGDAYRFGADALAIAAGLRDILSGGITTLRDCGHPHHATFAVREAIEAGLFQGPRLVLCGRVLAVSGGHGASLGIEADGVDEMRRAARVETKAGADWLKLMVTGGTATPGELVTDVQMTAEEISAAVDEAHRRGRRVCAHVSNLAGARLAISAGVDSIEHGIVLDQGAVEELRDRSTWLVPTLGCTQAEALAGPADGVPDFVRLKAAAIFPDQCSSFRRALAAGVRIAAATDSGPSYLPIGINSLTEELQLMVEHGMLPVQALLSATAHAAEMLGLSHETGMLSTGLSADILVVDGDPLSDLGTLRRPWLVVSKGKIVSSHFQPN